MEPLRAGATRNTIESAGRCRRGRPEKSAIEAKAKALKAANAAQNKKGQNITIIDVEGLCSYTDALVIVTAWSERQTAAIADAVIEELKKEERLRPLQREGTGPWILIDYGDVVIHVFHEDTRAFYDLDKIWAQAPRVPVPPPAAMAG